MVKRNLQKCHKIKCLLDCIPGICIEQRLLLQILFNFPIKKKKKKPVSLNLKMATKSLLSEKKLKNIIERARIVIFCLWHFHILVGQRKPQKQFQDSSFLLRYRPLCFLIFLEIPYANFPSLSCYTHLLKIAYSVILNF